MRERKYKIEFNSLVRRSTGVPLPEDDLQHKAEVKKSIDDFKEFRDKFPERIKEPD